MANRALCLLALSSLVCCIQAAPLLGFEDEEVVPDTAIVESTVREVRALKKEDLADAPANYHKTYDHRDHDGDIGFTRQKSDKGNKGYQLFDSFHKKDGDSYGYEKHDAFGKNNKGTKGGHNVKASYTQKKRRNDEGKKNAGNGKKAAKYQAVDDGSYEVNEEGGGDYDESDGGAHYDDSSSRSEGSSGAGENTHIDYDEEASRLAQSGYDEDDAANYKNPSHYSYGSGDEYNF